METNVSINFEGHLLIDTLKSLQKQMTYTILIPLFIIGNIGCIFNTIIFLRPYLISSSCTRYFLASSFANVFQLNIGLASNIFDFGFAIHPYHNSSILCKFRNYLINVGGFLSQTYLLFACIDRYLITINKTRYRYLHHSMSQVKEKQFWFLDNHYSLENVLSWMGNFDNERVVAKHAARIAQCFTSTEPSIRVKV